MTKINFSVEVHHTGPYQIRVTSQRLATEEFNLFLFNATYSLFRRLIFTIIKSSGNENI